MSLSHRLCNKVFKKPMRKEIWETPFGNAHLKIERATKQIADIDKRLRASLDTHGPSLHLDGKTGSSSSTTALLTATSDLISLSLLVTQSTISNALLISHGATLSRGFTRLCLATKPSFLFTPQGKTLKRRSRVREK